MREATNAPLDFYVTFPVSFENLISKQDLTLIFLPITRTHCYLKICLSVTSSSREWEFNFQQPQRGDSLMHSCLELQVRGSNTFPQTFMRTHTQVTCMHTDRHTTHTHMFVKSRLYSRVWMKERPGKIKTKKLLQFQKGKLHIIYTRFFLVPSNNSHVTTQKRLINYKYLTQLRLRCLNKAMGKKCSAFLHN